MQLISLEEWILHSLKYLHLTKDLKETIMENRLERNINLSYEWSLKVVLPFHRYFPETVKNKNL